MVDHQSPSAVSIRRRERSKSLQSAGMLKKIASAVAAEHAHEEPLVAPLEAIHRDGALSAARPPIRYSVV